MSIIIVCVGDEDFAQMKELDSDDKLLESPSHKHKAVRDIVQFVALRDFVGKPVPLLAREVLREVPSQVLTYFTQKGIVPNAPAALPQQGPIPPQHA